LYSEAFSVIFYFLVLFYFIIFMPKWYALAAAAVGTELTAILLYKIYIILQFLCRFVNSAHDGQFCAKFCMRSITEF